MHMQTVNEANWTLGHGSVAIKGINPHLGALPTARKHGGGLRRFANDAQSSKRLFVVAAQRRSRGPANGGNSANTRKNSFEEDSSNAFTTKKEHKRSNTNKNNKIKNKKSVSATSGHTRRPSKGFGSYEINDKSRKVDKDREISSILESLFVSVDDPDDEEEEDDAEDHGINGTNGAFALDSSADELTDTEYAEVLGIETSPADALAGVNAEVEAALEAVTSSFHFPLDPFQVKSVRHIIAGRSVVVCAPTGAGKTAIAEGATKHFMELGGKIIYTTPLKALSNQKLYEMRETFGNEYVGLQTGDASINPEARIVVMTTEILRNMLYRTPDDPGGGVEVRLADVRLVVFDECHYLGDPGRGSVWEECVINLPRGILILAMSATVRNPADLCGWIASVHGRCDMVTTSFRPVPLSWHFCFAPNGTGGPAKLLPLLNTHKRAINPELLPPHIRFANQKQRNKEVGYGSWDRMDYKSDSKGNLGVSVRTLNELVGSADGDWFNKPRAERVPSVSAVVDILRKNSMLPAIWFIFSRKECDAAVQNLLASIIPEIGLTSAEERELILEEVGALQKDQPEAVKEEAVAPLAAGLAAHHAGCLPGWKALVERLFQRGLVKLVFATETLAAGINMPARTTVISSLSRRRDGGISVLTHNELLQMAGRAGRRGYDTLGHCIILQSRWEDAQVGYDIIRKGPEPLRSQFASNYGMVLNVLWSRTMDEAQGFLARSFSHYLGGAGAARVREEIQQLETAAQNLLDDAGRRADDAFSDTSSADTPSPSALWDKYQKLMGRRKEERRAARMLRTQLAEERGEIAAGMIQKIGFPCVVCFDATNSTIAVNQSHEGTGETVPAVAMFQITWDDVSGIWSRDTTVFPRGLAAALMDEEVEGNVWGMSRNAVYVCIGMDNRVYAVPRRYICSVGNVQEMPWVHMDDDTKSSITASICQLKRLSWRISKSNVGILVAPGSALTATKVASKLPLNTDFDLIQPASEGLEAFYEQRSRVSEVKSEIERIKTDKLFAQASKHYSKVMAKAEALLDRSKLLRLELDGRLEGGWRQFERIVKVLEESGAFQADSGMSSKGFSPLGLVAREIRASNELWIAVALTHASVQTLTPPILAAVVSALVAPDAFNRANVYVAYPPSDTVTIAVAELEPVRASLMATQVEAGVDMPVVIDIRMAGVVEAWASGIGWREITADCGLDDGDVARLLMRTVDTLRQIAYCQHLLPGLRSSARMAARAMDRKPISDLVA